MGLPCDVDSRSIGSRARVVHCARCPAPGQDYAKLMEGTGKLEQVDTADWSEQTLPTWRLSGGCTDVSSLGLRTSCRVPRTSLEPRPRFTRHCLFAVLRSSGRLSHPLSPFPSDSFRPEWMGWLRSICSLRWSTGRRGSQRSPHFVVPSTSDPTSCVGFQSPESCRLVDRRVARPMRRREHGTDQWGSSTCR